MDGNKTDFLAEINKQFAFQRSLMFNQPFDYKGILFHPVSVENLLEFYTCVNVLMFKQERCKEKRLTKMPYLWYLVCVGCESTEPEFQMVIPLLCALLQLVTKSNDVDILTVNGANGDFRKCILKIGGIEISHKDFEKISEIILSQSGIDFDGDFSHEDALNNSKESTDFENKQNGYIHPSLENLLDITAMYLHKSPDEIAKTFTIRKFNNLIKHMSKYEDYKLLKGAELCGMVSFKNSIPHWISGFEKQNAFSGENSDYINGNLLNI